MTNFKHYTVMKREAVDSLNCKDGLIYVDATLGGGGHSEEILKKIAPNGHLIAFDVDEDAIAASRERLQKYKNLTIVKNSYTNIKKVLKNLQIKSISGGILFDLGASYHQLTKCERGFSFTKSTKLDMRFNQYAEFNALDVFNGYSEADLVRIFSEYGEERFSKKIKKKIVDTRKVKSIENTDDLAKLIVEATPRIKSSIHPATRVFQAIRIEVNQELTNVKNTLNDVFDLLENGAIISVISFHSLEDRLVKNFFRDHMRHQKVNKYKVSGEKEPPSLEVITKKPIVASEMELVENPPSRSAKLRVARKVSS